MMLHGVTISFNANRDELFKFLEEKGFVTPEEYLGEKELRVCNQRNG